MLHSLYNGLTSFGNGNSPLLELHSPPGTNQADGGQHNSSRLKQPGHDQGSACLQTPCRCILARRPVRDSMPCGAGLCCSISTSLGEDPSRCSRHTSTTRFSGGNCKHVMAHQIYSTSAHFTLLTGVCYICEMLTDVCCSKQYVATGMAPTVLVWQHRITVRMCCNRHVGPRCSAATRPSQNVFCRRCS